MKRLLSLVLSGLLCISLCACSSDPRQKEIDYIVSLLEEENYDMAIYVIEGLRNLGSASPTDPTQSQAPEYAGAHPGNRQIMEPELEGTDMHFIMDLFNDSQEVLTLKRLEILDEHNGGPLELVAVFEGDDLRNVGLDGLVLEYDCGTLWEDWHPVVEGFSFRLYRFVFINSQGEEIPMEYPFSLPAVASSDMPAGPQEESWNFNILLENTTDSQLRLVGLEIHDLLSGAPAREPFLWDESSLTNIGLGEVVLQPGQTLQWGDGHPVVDFFDFREYRFIFVDPNGKESVQSFPFDLTQMPTTGNKNMNYAGDPGQDLLTLRHEASFCVEVAPGVYWVNASSLGRSGYSNQEIHHMLPCTPDEKQSQIHVLYEALQLYQVGGFYASDDNIRIREGSIHWEHHKPGYHAVRTNTGCCATDSNWLNYLLRNEYEEIGFIATSQRDGSGHVYNYIFHEGYYYFIDLTHYRTDWIATAIESGDLADYRRSDMILGNIHKAKSVQDYVNYVQSTFSDPPGLMFQYRADDCLAIDSVVSDSGITITYEKADGVDIRVIFDDPNDCLFFDLAPAPQIRPDYAKHPDFDFFSV